MKPLLVVSVPHSGTMFTWNLLPGKRGHFPSAVCSGFRDGYKYYAHVLEPGLDTGLRECFVVVPTRAGMADSWARRGMSQSELAMQMRLIDGIDGFRLPLDGKDRDSRLAQLSELIGVTLSTDWRPIHSVRAA